MEPIGKVCIAKPNEYSYSETFIVNQISNVDHDFLITRGWYPILEDGNGLLIKGLFRNHFYRGFLKRFLPNLFERIYTRQLSDYFLSRRIKIVLANYGVLGSNITKACSQNNILLFVHFHGFDAAHKETVEQFRSKYLGMFQYCKNIISVSNVMTQKLIEIGADPSKIVRIPYGVDLNKFKCKLEWLSDKRIYYVGRFTAKKAPDKLILAFQKVLEKHHDAELHMIGDGELFDETVKLISKLGLSEKIVLHGKQSPDYIATELSKARIFMQHSVVAANGDSEGTPNTILEASAMGLPIVSTRHAGIMEAVVENQTGFLVDEHDWETMGQKASMLLDDLDLCIKMGKEARRHVETNYNLIGQTRKLEDLIMSRSDFDQQSSGVINSL